MEEYKNIFNGKRDLDSFKKNKRLENKKFLYPTAHIRGKIGIGFLNGLSEEYNGKDINAIFRDLENTYGFNYTGYYNYFRDYIQVKDAFSEIRKNEDFQFDRNRQNKFYSPLENNCYPIDNLLTINKNSEIDESGDSFSMCVYETKEFISILNDFDKKLTEKYTFLDIDKEYNINGVNTSFRKEFEEIRKEYIATINYINGRLSKNNVSNLNSEQKDFLRKHLEVDNVDEALRNLLSNSMQSYYETVFKNINHDGLKENTRYYKEVLKSKKANQFPERNETIENPYLDPEANIDSLFLNEKHILPIIKSMGIANQFKADPEIFGEVSLLNYLFVGATRYLDDLNNRNVFEMCMDMEFDTKYFINGQNNANFKKYFISERSFIDHMKDIIRKVDPDGILFPDDHVLFQTTQSKDLESMGIEPGIRAFMQKRRDWISDADDDTHFIPMNFSICKIHMIDKILFEILYEMPKLYANSIRTYMSYDILPIIYEISRISMMFHMAIDYLNYIYRIRSFLGLSINPTMECFTMEGSIDILADKIFGRMFETILCTARDSAVKMRDEIREITLNFMKKNSKMANSLLEANTRTRPMNNTTYEVKKSKTFMPNFDSRMGMLLIDRSLNIRTGFKAYDDANELLLNRKIKRKDKMLDRRAIHRRGKFKMQNLSPKRIIQEPNSLTVAEGITYGITPMRDGSNVALQMVNYSKDEVPILYPDGTVIVLQPFLHTEVINDIEPGLDKIVPDMNMANLNSDKITFGWTTFDATDPHIEDDRAAMVVIDADEFMLPKNEFANPLFVEKYGSLVVFRNEEHFYHIMEKYGNDVQAFFEAERKYKHYSATDDANEISTDKFRQELWNLNNNNDLYTIIDKKPAKIPTLKDGATKDKILYNNGIHKEALRQSGYYALYTIATVIDSIVETNDGFESPFGDYAAKDVSVDGFVTIVDNKKYVDGEPIMTCVEGPATLIFHSQRSATVFLEKYGTFQKWIEESMLKSSSKQVLKEERKEVVEHTKKEVSKLVAATTSAVVATVSAALVGYAAGKNKQNQEKSAATIMRMQDRVRGLGKFRIDTSRKPADETTENIAKIAKKPQNLEEFKQEIAKTLSKFETDIINKKKYRDDSIKAFNHSIAMMKARDAHTFLGMANKFMNGIDKGITKTLSNPFKLF